MHLQSYLPIAFVTTTFATTAFTISCLKLCSNAKDICSPPSTQHPSLILPLRPRLPIILIHLRPASLSQLCESLLWPLAILWTTKCSNIMRLWSYLPMSFAAAITATFATTTFTISCPEPCSNVKTHVHCWIRNMFRKEQAKRKKQG